MQFELVEMFSDLLLAKLSKKTTWGRNEVEKLILESKAQAAIDLLRKKETGND